MRKPRVAFFSFTSCEGCQLVVLELERELAALAKTLDIVRFREASSRREDHFDIAFVEGSVTTIEEAAKVRWIRETAGVVVAIGACATLGGVNAIRTGLPGRQVSEAVYGTSTGSFPAREVLPVSEIVEVDHQLHGCPMVGSEFLELVTCLVTGRKFRPPEFAVCTECVLRGTTCHLWKGRACLGPVARAGCRAICPAAGDPCTACRGLFEEANVQGLPEAFGTIRNGSERARELLSLFNARAMAQLPLELDDPTPQSAPSAEESD